MVSVAASGPSWLGFQSQLWSIFSGKPWNVDVLIYCQGLGSRIVFVSDKFKHVVLKSFMHFIVSVKFLHVES